MADLKSSEVKQEENVEHLYDKISFQNLQSIHCEACGLKIVKELTASFKTDLKFNLKLMKNKDGLSTEEVSRFWCLTNMLDFENVGFSNTVNTIKYLCCADCEIGPIGFHDLNDKDNFYVAVDRVIYK